MLAIAGSLRHGLRSPNKPGFRVHFNRLEDFRWASGNVTFFKCQPSARGLEIQALRLTQFMFRERIAISPEGLETRLSGNPPA